MRSERSIPPCTKPYSYLIGGPVGIYAGCPGELLSMSHTCRKGRLAPAPWKHAAAAQRQRTSQYHLERQGCQLGGFKLGGIRSQLQHILYISARHMKSIVW